jgi:thioredoxin reductase (NADPH)
MSQYLIDEISATPNIDVRARARIAAAEGTGKLQSLSLQDTVTGATQTVPASALLILIGAVPHTDWLPPRIRRDEHGFILTGSDIVQDGGPAGEWSLPRPPHPLETSMPGIFSAGDVRHGSIKRVASAVGEGSIAVTQLHQYLQQQAQTR